MLKTSPRYVRAVHKPSPLRRLVHACTLGAALASLGGCGSETPAATGPPDARLIVIPEATDESMFGLVSGTLGINDQGCFTLDDRVLVVGMGSRVLPGEDSINIADVGTVDVGSQAAGAGGSIDGLDEVERFAQAMDLGDEVKTCQADADNPALTVLDPTAP